MRHRLALTVAAILILATSGPASAAPQDSLQSAFESAAREFRVPTNVLLAVSYVVSRWEPSTTTIAAGPMQLLDQPTAADSDGLVFRETATVCMLGTSRSVGAPLTVASCPFRKRT